MTFATTLARNVFSNGFAFAVNVVVTFLLFPFVLETLGKDAAGLWVLLVSCTGYYGLLDAGIRSAVGQYVTRYFAQGDTERVNVTMTTATALMALAGTVVLLVGGAVAFVAPGVFETGAVEDSTTRVAFLIVALGVALNFPLLTFQSAAYARQRFDIVAGVAIAERLVSAALFVWVLRAGYGILGVAIVNAGVQLAANAVRTWIAFRLLPGLSVARRWFRRASVRELYGYSVFSVIINAGDQVLVRSSGIIIPLAIATDALTHYNVGAEPVFYMLQLVSAVAWALTPYATSQDARGDLASVRRLWVAGSRLILAFGAVVAGGILAVGDEFIALWVGSEYTDGVAFPSSALVAAILTFGALVRIAMTTGRQICFGMREVRFLARLGLAEAGLALGLCFALVWPFGIVGVAVGAVLASVSTQLWAMPLFLSRRLGVSLGEFVRSVPAPAASVLAAMVATETLLGDLLPGRDWGMFVARATVVTMPGIAAALLLGTTREEKERVLRLFVRFLPFRRSA